MGLFFLKKQALYGLMLTQLISTAALASYQYSGNRCHEVNPGKVVSKCRGREMPASKLRNFDHSSHELQCTSNSSYYIRRMQSMADFNKWYQMIKAKQINEAHALRLQAQPEIKWEGDIPYQTLEVWHWQTCETGTSSFHCGTHQDRKTRTVTKERCSPPDKDGRRNCTTYTEEEVYYETDANTCEYDHDQYEAWHCSNEVMNYSAKFDIDPSWKPGAIIDNPTTNNKKQTYHYALPHKYDLLQGESELVQTFNTGNKSATMNPKVEVGDAWNKYQAFANPSSFACAHDTKYHTDINIRTAYRLTNKASPNAFKAPVTPEGRPLSPFRWSEGEGSRPDTLVLMDSSAAMVQLIAEESRANADLQTAMLEKGKGTNKDGLSEKQQLEQGFFKDTQVRVKLKKVNRFWWNTTPAYQMITGETTAVVPSTNYTSDNQEVKYSDMWEISLGEMYDRKKNTVGINPSRLFGDVNLIPNRNYIYEVSMYQKGMPFYLPSCEDDEDKELDCTYLSWVPFYRRSQDDYFSKPIEVPFSTRKDFDQRNGLQKTFNFFDVIVGKRADSK